jgi:anti-sigma factor RsiW
MEPTSELKPPVILDACEPDKSTCHPEERVLSRYVSNELGPRRKKVVVQHLEACEHCRKSVARLNAIARTFRDWERSAIMEAGQRERVSGVR